VGLLKNSFKETSLKSRYLIYHRRYQMFALIALVCGLGYGAGFEGYNGHELRFGLYTPNAEYGYVVNDREIYLDTVFEKK
jgi:hypothetical protein